MASTYEYLSSLIDQTDRTVNATSAPETETIDALKGITDGADLANTVFPAANLRIPAKEMATLDEYDVSQAYSRIMIIYGSGRSDFYKVNTAASATRKNRLKYKKTLHDTLLENASAVEKKYKGE